MYAGNPREAADQVAALEEAGLDTVWVPEAYGFDSPTLMGYLAAKTERVEIGSAILNVYSRTPSALLQTAAGLDNVSQGRAIIGLGASGPQVIEGFHGVPYDKPLGRTKEIIELIRRRPAPRDARARRDLHAPAPRGPGHRTRQAAEADDQARAGPSDPALHRRPRPEERRGRRRVRRRLAAVPLRAREAPARSGATRSPPARPSGRRGWPAGDQRRRHGRDRRGPRDQGPARLRPPDGRAVRRRHGRARQELLQRPAVPVRLREGGEGDPGPLPRRQQARRRGDRADRAARAGQPRRPRVVRQGADRRLRRGRGDQPPGDARPPTTRPRRSVSCASSSTDPRRSGTAAPAGPCTSFQPCSAPPSGSCASEVCATVTSVAPSPPARRSRPPCPPRRRPARRRPPSSR